MADAAAFAPGAPGLDRRPPYSEEAERGVLGSILQDSVRVMNLCVERHLDADSFYVPAHRTVYEAMQALYRQQRVIDVLTLSEQLKIGDRLEHLGGAPFLAGLIDATPTAAHAEYYIAMVHERHLLRCIINCAREAETSCYGSPESAEQLLGDVEQSFLQINERRYGGDITTWPEAVRSAMDHIEHILSTRRGLTGISTGFLNIDRIMLGLRPSEMIVLAARPSMGKTSLAMNMAENVALGVNDPDRKGRQVGIFSLEMSHESLVMRMLCAHARVRSEELQRGTLSRADHGKLTQAASALTKAPIYLDDTGGLDILELRARARRMQKKYGVQLIVIDYLQLLHSKEYARQGRQIETADISGNLKAMAKELKVPVLVLSQLSRAPEQRSNTGRPKLSDLRDSGAIEQDADVVLMLRRPCKYEGDQRADDDTLAVVDIAKHRNGGTGEFDLNFEEQFTRFTDRARPGVDGFGDEDTAPEDEAAA